MAAKLDAAHIGLLIGAPVATGFVDYLVNSASPFSKQTLIHAALAAVLVGLAIVKDLAKQAAAGAASTQSQDNTNAKQ